MFERNKWRWIWRFTNLTEIIQIRWRGRFRHISNSGRGVAVHVLYFTLLLTLVYFCRIARTAICWK